MDFLENEDSEDKHEDDGEYDFESYECNGSICFLNITPIDGVSSLLIVKNQGQIKEVSYFSLDYQSYKLKFKNFLMETVKINYTPPEGYEFIEYDWFKEN